MITLLTCVLHILLLYIMSYVVPSPPSDLAVEMRFVDYNPVVTMTWKVSVLCVCASVRACVRAWYSKVLNATWHSQVPN